MAAKYLRVQLAAAWEQAARQHHHDSHTKMGQTCAPEACAAEPSAAPCMLGGGVLPWLVMVLPTSVLFPRAAVLRFQAPGNGTLANDSLNKMSFWEVLFQYGPASSLVVLGL